MNTAYQIIYTKNTQFQSHVRKDYTKLIFKIINKFKNLDDNIIVGLIKNRSTNLYQYLSSCNTRIYKTQDEKQVKSRSFVHKVDKILGNECNGIKKKKFSYETKAKKLMKFYW